MSSKRDGWSPSHSPKLRHGEVRKRLERILDALVDIEYSHFFEGAPDLAIEILSPSNRPYQIRAKVADYLAAGCRLVWVVGPERRSVTTYRGILAPRILSADDELDGEDIFPGLRVKVGSIFEPGHDVNG